MQPFPHLQITTRPHLSFVGAKTNKTSLMSNKTRPGRSLEHAEANLLNAEFVPTPKPVEETSTDFAPETAPDPEPSVA